MADNILNRSNGESELKDYYDQYGSTYEAIKRRRKKSMEKQGLEQQEDTDFNKYINVDL